jgi:hypothetical protein
MKKISAWCLAMGMAVMMASCGTPASQRQALSDLQARAARFAPVVITADTTTLSPGDRAALRTLVEAAACMDSLYLRQSWSGSPALLAKLEADRSPLGEERLRYFLINMGPWSALDGDSAFVGGVPVERPPQANYYPDDMTKEEFQKWVGELPEAEQKQAIGFFHTIRRDSSRRLVTVPYSDEYRDMLAKAAALLREAAALTDNASLKVFLTKRAEAFLSNDYYDSDVAWLRLDSPIDVTIGPYEVYMDRLFNYKAAFEAFITLKNEQESAKLVKFARWLQKVEDHLPIAARYRNPKLGAAAPISVVDEVAIGGEARAGIQTAAFNLPNDERITAREGSKRVMLRNVQQAKFDSILQPIADATIDPAQRPLVDFDVFFTHILAHELMHGLGPHSITVGGKPTTVRQAMKELGSSLEEAKADISGLFMLQYLIDQGVVDKATEEKMYVTYLAGMFRSIRFGVNDAHGRGMALQFNYLTDAGAVRYDEASGRYRVDVAAAKDAVRKLTGEIMTIQAEGDYEAAKRLLEQNAVVRPAMQKTLGGLRNIPVDIAPSFPLTG